MRGQANLLALGVALFLVTTVAAMSVAVADGAFRSAERDAVERTTAEDLSERLVAADSPVTERRNVLDSDRLEESRFDRVVPDGVDVRIAVDGEVVYERGDPTDGRTVRRLAVLASPQAVTIEPPLENGRVTLPRRSPRATIEVPADADVETVRADDRVVLHDADGIEGDHDVPLSRYRTTTLRFEGASTEGVTVTYYPRRTLKVLLEVSVDA